MRASRGRRALAVAFAAVALVATGVEVARTDPPEDRGRPEWARGASRDAANLQVVRRWRDTVKVRGRDESRVVEIAYDREAGVARRRVFDASGVLVTDEVLGDQPQPSAEEIARAFAKVRADPDLGGVLRGNRGVLDGGFLLREAEGEPCGPDTRCLQVFMLSESRWELLGRSLIDVRSDRIVNRNRPPGHAD